MLHFNAWLHQQFYRADLVGEISLQARRLGNDWPKTNDLLAFRVYLARDRATVLAIHAVEVAHEEWRRSCHLPALNAPGNPSGKRS